MFKSFQEYIDQNKKMVEKPKVSKVADFEGKQPTKPEKESKVKDAGGAGQVGDVKPYSNGENTKDPNKEDKSGLVYKGDKNLVYEPKVDEKSKETKTWPKTGMSEWVKETKGLSLAEFTRKLKEEDGECSKDMHALSRGVVEACQCSKKNVLTFVREAKRGKILESLMGEIFNIPESYEILSGLIENDLYSKKFDKMFNEMVAEPVGMEDEAGEREMGDGEDMGDDMEGEEGMGDEEGMEDDMEDEEGMEGDMDDEEGMEGSGEIKGMMGPDNPFLPKRI